MSRKSISYARGYEHSNFDNLLSELQGEKNDITASDGTATIVITASAEVIPVKEESEERHRIMSNEKIKYLYSKQENIIHDKHCMCAKCIPDEEMLWSEEYLSELTPCSDCMIRAYVVVGAKDPKEVDKYLAFFEKSQMSTGQIRNIYVELGMKTRISMDAMTIWYKEDAWRIKNLPKKGHVQLYHNNYAIRKRGVREFTQGFHVQSPACSDTNIDYALNIIKNYEYKPEEYALHKGKVNPSEKKKAKQYKVEKMEIDAVPLEDILGEKKEEPSIWQKLKSHIKELLKKKTFFELNDFQLVSEHGYPKNQTVCIYIWRDKNGNLFWQTGLYNQKMKHFSIRYGVAVYSIKQEKVIAWKKMNADAVALEIECADIR